MPKMPVIQKKKSKKSRNLKSVLNLKQVVLLSKIKCCIFAVLSACLMLSLGCGQAAKPLNPNGDSELAVLMRAMHDSAVRINTMINQGTKPSVYPDAFIKIYTAKPTVPLKDKAGFDIYATDYLNSLKYLKESTPEDFNSNYNSMLRK